VEALAIVEIGTATVTAKPVGNNFWGVWRKAPLDSPGYQQVGSFTGTLGGQCGQLEHQYKLETIGWTGWC
jgi:hypothetical protein